MTRTAAFFPLNPFEPASHDAIANPRYVLPPPTGLRRPSLCSGDCRAARPNAESTEGVHQSRNGGEEKRADGARKKKRRRLPNLVRSRTDRRRHRRMQPLASRLTHNAIFLARENMFSHDKKSTHEPHGVGVEDARESLLPAPVIDSFVGLSRLSLSRVRRSVA